VLARGPGLVMVAGGMWTRKRGHGSLTEPGGPTGCQASWGRWA